MSTYSQLKKIEICAPLMSQNCTRLANRYLKMYYRWKHEKKYTSRLYICVYSHECISCNEYIFF